MSFKCSMARALNFYDVPEVLRAVQTNRPVEQMPVTSCSDPPSSLNAILCSRSQASIVVPTTPTF